MKTINLFILEFTGMFLLITSLFDGVFEGTIMSIGILISCVYIGIERGVRMTKEVDQDGRFPARKSSCINALINEIEMEKK